eukprot:COSAG06_NODE_304_length_17855_cov_47.399414_15_plen_68_part_00
MCVCVFTGCAAVRYYAADGSEQNLLDDYLLTAVRRNSFLEPLSLRTTEHYDQFWSLPRQARDNDRKS